MGDFNGYVNSADKTGDTEFARHSETINEVSELNEWVGDRVQQM